MSTENIKDLNLASWHTGSGFSVDKDVLLCAVKDSYRNSGKIYIGTDSHRAGKNFIFATVICLHGAVDQQGGNYFFLRRKRKKSMFSSLQQRLLFETSCSVEIANYLKDMGVKNIEVHVDCSPKDASHQSGRSADLLRGYVTSCGFGCEIKPDSWAAHSIADRHAR